MNKVMVFLCFIKQSDLKKNQLAKVVHPLLWLQNSIGESLYGNVGFDLYVELHDLKTQVF